ncbi:MAG: heme-binding domain-containing protein [Flavobacteriaceae bacterium]|jgi:hypothetical protein|nr:cytochrome C [Flavobacteriaceae bacterium]
MKQHLKWIRPLAIIALIALFGIQFIPVASNSQGYESVRAFERETQMSPELTEVFQTNCYDCHSNQTQYPWYSKIAPVNFWLDEHVRDGKKHFNVSEWGQYSIKRKDHKLEELIEEVQEQEMPLPSYTWIHGKLSPQDRQALIDWAQMVRLSYQQVLPMK